MSNPSKASLGIELMFKVPHRWRYRLAERMVRWANRLVLNPVDDKEHGFGYEFVDHRTSEFSKMGLVNQSRAINESILENSK